MRQFISKPILPFVGLLTLIVLSASQSRLAAQPASPPPFYTDKINLLFYLDRDGTKHPITKPKQWKRRRDHILANMQLVMGPLPADARRVPLDVQFTGEVRLDKYTRHKLTFAVEPGDRLPAYLLIPHELTDQVAAVLCLHQTVKIGKDEPVGLGGKPNLRYAAELADRGFVTLAVDYPNFGEYQFDAYEHGYASATMKGIWNHSRAVDLLQSLPQVDPERIGVIGHSLGGHNSLFVAAFDSRIKCVVSCCGFCSFPYYFEGNLTGWSHAGYMPRIRDRYGLDPGRMPFDFTEVIAAIAPRACLAVAPVEDENFDVRGVKACLEAAQPIYRLLGATERLSAIYPEGGHDFPLSSRESAYSWMERWLLAESDDGKVN